VNEVDDLIEKLESIKYSLSVDAVSSRELGFLSEVLDNIFYDKIPYMARVELISYYEKYHLKGSEGDSWYGFDLKDKNSFMLLCEKIREQLGLNVD
jgi:hypothetical protein